MSGFGRWRGFGLRFGLGLLRVWGLGSYRGEIGSGSSRWRLGCRLWFRAEGFRVLGLWSLIGVKYGVELGRG